VADAMTVAMATSENKARIEVKNETIAEEERIIAEEEVRIAELERAMAEELQKCDAMQRLKQEAEGKVGHLETKLLEAEEEVLSLKLKLGEGGEEVESHLDAVMEALNENVEQSEGALAEEQTRRYAETVRADDLLVKTQQLQLSMEVAKERATAALAQQQAMLEEEMKA
jgi:hypothetical protein